MININMKDKLVKRDEESARGEEVVVATQKLLDTHEQKKRSTLIDLGMTHELDHHTKEMEAKMLRRTFREKYGSGIVTVSEIEELCVKYRLRFLPSDKFVGKIDAQLPGVIAAYCEKHGITARCSFMIMAPAESFRLRVVEGETWISAAARRFADSFKDPVMFHSLGNGHYRIVHAWGGDFTFMRRMLAYPFQSANTMTVSAACALFAIFGTLGAILGAPVWSLCVIGAFSFLGGLLYARVGRFDSKSYNRIFYSNYNWDMDQFVPPLLKFNK